MPIANALFKTDENFNVEIVSFGDSNLSDPRFRLVSIEESITMLSKKGLKEYFNTDNPTSTQIESAIEKYKIQVGHDTRPFFGGKLIDLAMLSVDNCIKKAKISPSEIEKFHFVSNTLKPNEGYSSQADAVMKQLSILYPGPQGLSKGYAKFSQEACSIGVLGVIEDAFIIQTGLISSSLITAAELATNLADQDEWKFHNLFGDRSGSIYIRRGERSFLAMGAKTFPYSSPDSPSRDSKDLITQKEDGYLFQDGQAVFKWVNGTMLKELKESLEEIDFDYSVIDHIVYHQPSIKLSQTLRENTKNKFPKFKGNIPFDKNAGNTSSASTLSLLSRLIDSGEIKPGEIVLVCAFGAGLTWAFYIFIAPRLIK